MRTTLTLDPDVEALLKKRMKKALRLAGQLEDEEIIRKVRRPESNP
jgi:hypothetical protein